VLDPSDLLRDRVRRGDLAITAPYYHLDTVRWKGRISARFSYVPASFASFSTGNQQN
jgi:hypothetical protein